MLLLKRHPTAPFLPRCEWAKVGIHRGNLTTGAVADGHTIGKVISASESYCVACVVVGALARGGYANMQRVTCGRGGGNLGMCATIGIDGLVCGRWVMRRCARHCQLIGCERR